MLLWPVFICVARFFGFEMVNSRINCSQTNLSQDLSRVFRLASCSWYRVCRGQCCSAQEPLQRPDQNFVDLVFVDVRLWRKIIHRHFRRKNFRNFHAPPFAKMMTWQISLQNITKRISRLIWTQKGLAGWCKNAKWNDNKRKLSD